MNEQLYLVDFENVPGVDLSGISFESRVIVFTGVNQRSVPLAQAISSFFPKKLTKAAVEAIITKLVTDKKISENAGAISYAFNPCAPGC